MENLGKRIKKKSFLFFTFFAFSKRQKWQENTKPLSFSLFSFVVFSASTVVGFTGYLHLQLQYTYYLFRKMLSRSHSIII